MIDKIRSNVVANIAMNKKIMLTDMAKRDYDEPEKRRKSRSKDERIINDLCNLFNGWPLKDEDSKAVAKILLDDPEYVRMAKSFDTRHKLTDDRDSSVMIMTQRYLDGDDFVQ